jgi:hypothetical protein
MKRYMPSATRRALAVRAIQMANLLEQLAEQLQEAAEKQDVKLWGRVEGDPDIILKRSEVKFLVDVMSQGVQEVRRLART